MVRHPPAKDNDLAKIIYKPGKFKIIKTTKLHPISKNISVQSTSMNDSNTEESTINMAETSTSTAEASSSIKSALKISIPTQNRYEALENADEDVMEILSDSEDTINKNKSINKGHKPPPIVLHYKIESHSNFVQKLQTHVQKGFTIKNTKNNTNLFIQDADEYRKYLQVLEAEQVNYHTYTEKGNKTHAFILKGIDSNPTPEEIKEYLEENYKFKVVNVYKLKNTNRDMYLIITDNTIYLKYLIANVKYVCYTKITWERHQNKNKIVQCRRCQQWGHATSNCRAEPICTKCSKKHYTKECTLVIKEIPETHKHIKCANCQGSHLAFSRDCPVYKKRVESSKNERRKTTKSNEAEKTPKYVPSTGPTINPWIREPQLRRESYEMIQTRLHNNKDNQHSVQTLISEFNELDKLINIDNMIRLVRELNLTLRTCDNQLDKFLKFREFCNKISMADNNKESQCLP